MIIQGAPAEAHERSYQVLLPMVIIVLALEGPRLALGYSGNLGERVGSLPQSFHLRYIYSIYSISLWSPQIGARVVFGFSVGTSSFPLVDRIYIPPTLCADRYPHYQGSGR